MDANNTFCIYLEYLSGGSVTDLYKKYGALNEITTLKYTKQILVGLIYLHSQGVVHGDLKGANVLLNKDCSLIKLCDLGNARFIDQDKSSKSINSVINGTLAWMAPELYRSHTRKKSDVWSLGCLIVEMLTGENPWGKRFDAEGTSAVMAIQKALEEGEKPILPSNVSKECKGFVNRCL